MAGSLSDRSQLHPLAPGRARWQRERKLRGELHQTKAAPERKIIDSLETPASNTRQHGTAHSYDLLIVDVLLPTLGDFDLCRQVRQRQGSVPILLLTALSEVEQRITGLHSGADDYLCKPFSQTYPSVDTPPLALGSCFFTASFTRDLCLVPELATPQAF